MNAVYTLILSVMDSFWVQIIFAVWTGVWLVQIMRGDSKTSQWVFVSMGLAFVVALFVVKGTPSQNSA